MKNKIIQVIILILLIGIILPNKNSFATEDNSFSISIVKDIQSSEKVKVGDIVNVELSITNGMEKQNQLAIIIKYDSTKLELLADEVDEDGNKILKEGESISNEIILGDSKIIMGLVNEDSTASIVYYLNSEEEYLKTEAILATLKFKVIAEGSSDVTYSKIEYALGNTEPTAIESNSKITIETANSQQSITGKLGDTDGNDKITTKDAKMVLQHIVKKITLTPEQLKRADADKNNKITTKDAKMILQHIVKKITLS